MKNFDCLLSAIESFECISMDVETTGLGRTSEIISFAFALLDADNSIYSQSFFLDRYSNRKQEVHNNTVIVEHILSSTLFNSKFKGVVLFHNLNFDLPLIISRFRPDMKRIRSADFCKMADTAAISRVFRNNAQTSHVDAKSRRPHSLKFLVELLLEKSSINGTRPSSLDQVTQGLSIRFSNSSDLDSYNRSDCENTIKIYIAFQKLLSVDEWKYIEEIEIPHSFNLLHLTFHGVPYAQDRADNIASSIDGEIQELNICFNRLVGKNVNLDSGIELAGALFYNSRLTYRSEHCERPEILKPLYITEREQSKIDLDTLEATFKFVERHDPESLLLNAISLAIRYIELSKSRSALERLNHYATKTSKGYRIFPNISASAASGRVTCSRPNLLGIPKKIFKKSQKTMRDGQDLCLIPAHNSVLVKTSIRNTIQTPTWFSIGSIDINGLDLTVIANGAVTASGNKNFYWLKFINRQFGEVIDSHFALLQKLDKSTYLKAFERLVAGTNISPLDFWAKKPSMEDGKKYILFLHKITGERHHIPFPDDGQESERLLEGVRDLSKKFNFATSYLVGPPAFAAKLREVRNDKTTSIEAEMILRRFYKLFPEVRRFQDSIGNLIYQQGYVQCPFGRKFYAAVWDRLNSYYEQMSRQSDPGTYEFILRIKDKYWFIRAHGWIGRLQLS